MFGILSATRKDILNSLTPQSATLFGNKVVADSTYQTSTHWINGLLSIFNQMSLKGTEGSEEYHLEMKKRELVQLQAQEMLKVASSH